MSNLEKEIETLRYHQQLLIHIIQNSKSAVRFADCRKKYD